MSGEETVQYRVFRDHYCELVRSIQDPDSLADDLFSRHLLGSGTLQDVQVEGLSTWRKTRKILLAVEGQIIAHADKFELFLEALRSDPSRNYLADKLSQACDDKSLRVQDVLAELKGFYGWVPLGLCLGVPADILAQIHSAHGHGFDAVSRCMVKVIEAWLERSIDAPWVTLATVLCHVGRRSLAIKIADKFGFKDHLLSSPAPCSELLQKKGVNHLKKELDELDSQLVQNHTEFEECEKEKEIMSKACSISMDKVDTDKKYIESLKVEKEQICYILAQAEENHSNSKSKKQREDVEKLIEDLRNKVASGTQRLDRATSELQKRIECMKVFTERLSELSTQQNCLRGQRCELTASLRQKEEALNRDLLGNFHVVVQPQEKDVVAYYNVIISSSGKREVKLRQSEVQLMEQKIQQKQSEIDLLNSHLLNMQEKIQKIQKNLHSLEEDGHYSYAYQCLSDEMVLARLQCEGISAKLSITSARSQKCQLQCETDMQNQEIIRIQQEIPSTATRTASPVFQTLRNRSISLPAPILPPHHPPPPFPKQISVLKHSTTPVNLGIHIGCFFGKISREFAEILLYLNESGTFLIRESVTLSMVYTLSLIYNGEVIHYRIIKNESSGLYSIEYKEEFRHRSPKFPNLEVLVQYYLIQAAGLKCPLKNPCPRSRLISSEWEIKGDIEMHKKLASRENCDMWEGKWRDRIVVARVSKTDTIKASHCLSEAVLRTKLNHSNIIQLYGVNLTVPLYLITEYMCNGHLQNYLATGPGQLWNTNDIVNAAKQVASGMAYLESQHCIHRNLKASNVMVGDKNVVKIGGFGLAHITKITFFREEKDLLFPVKWTAPETFKASGFFTSKSDVWSYGILLWEMCSHGKMPYPGMTSYDTFRKVNEGYRMQCPCNCPGQLYQLMLNTWNYNPDGRPSFQSIETCLGDIVSGDQKDLFDETVELRESVIAENREDVFYETMMSRESVIAENREND